MADPRLLSTAPASHNKITESFSRAWPSSVSIDRAPEQRLHLPRISQFRRHAGASCRITSVSVKIRGVAAVQLDIVAVHDEHGNLHLPVLAGNKDLHACT